MSAGLRELVGSASVLVCCGSGGVGKTTTAAVLAMEGARQGRRADAAVLLRALVDAAAHFDWRLPEVLAGYPRFVEFLRFKRRFDPEERFQSNWYRHYRTMFADQL